MNNALQKKCDKIITNTTSKTLLYEDIIAEISKNKDLLRYKTTIPNALEYFKDNGFTIKFPQINESIESEDTTATKNVEKTTNKSSIDDLDAVSDEEIMSNEAEAESIETVSADDFDEVLNDYNEPTDEELEKIESDTNSTEYCHSDAVKWYLNQVAYIQDRNLTAEEEQKYARLAQQGDKNARDMLANYNLKLVVSIAKKYNYDNSAVFDFSDTIQSGNIGLLKAIERFDPNRGYKFSTYATWWIRQAITRAVADESRLIRIPVHAVDQIRYINKAIKCIQAENNSSDMPEYEEIAKYCTSHGWVVNTNTAKEKILTKEQVKLYMERLDAATTVSIEVPVGEDGDSFLKDFIPDPTMNIETEAEHSDIRDKFDYVFRNFLTEREAKVLQLRYGFNGNDPMTLEQVGQIFGVTRERIRQIENKAKLKIKKSARIRRLFSE